MPKHTPWSRLRVKTSSDPYIHREQVAYVRGYLLALDDMIKDLELYRNSLRSGVFTDPHKTLMGFLDVILRSRYQALHTQKVLLLVYKDKEVPRGEAVQAPPDEAEAPRPGTEPAQPRDELLGPPGQAEASPRPASKSERRPKAQSWAQVYEQDDWN